MRTSHDVIAELQSRGELWEHARGLVGLRGDALALYRALEREIGALAGRFTDDEWQVPPAVTFGTLARADYFACFPQWLTAAAHLGGDLEAVADAACPAEAALGALAPLPVALQPAVCYHVYAELAGQVLRDARCCTVQGTCWRDEGERCSPLERGWAFIMREVVCAGSAADVESFRAHGTAAAVELAHRLGLRCEVEVATDPFFAPSSRGRVLVQRMKALKHELLLPLGGGRTVAAASFNNHERFFGEAFGIVLEEGSAASTGCIAFGLERWLLAVLVEHGTDARDWPLAVSAEAVSCV